MFRIALGFSTALKPAVAALFLASLAFTSAEAVSIRFDVVGGDPEADVSDLGSVTPIDHGDGNPYAYWNVEDSPVLIEGVRLNSWTVQVADRWLSNNVNVTNETGSAQTVVASVSQPLDSTLSFSSIVSSSFGIAFTDSDADNSLVLQPAGSPFYLGTVNSTPLLGLGVSIGSLSTENCAPFRFAGCSGSDTDGIVSAAASGLADALGIVLRFEISPGDSVALTSRFELSPDSTTNVPEPATGVLMALGMTALAASGRNRKRTA